MPKINVRKDIKEIQSWNHSSVKGSTLFYSKGKFIFFKKSQKWGGKLFSIANFTEQNVKCVVHDKLNKFLNVYHSWSCGTKKSKINDFEGLTSAVWQQFQICSRSRSCKRSIKKFLDIIRIKSWLMWSLYRDGTELAIHRCIALLCYKFFETLQQVLLLYIFSTFPQLFPNTQALKIGMKISVASFAWFMDLNAFISGADEIVFSTFINFVVL